MSSDWMQKPVVLSSWVFRIARIVWTVTLSTLFLFSNSLQPPYYPVSLRSHWTIIVIHFRVALFHVLFLDVLNRAKRKRKKQKTNFNNAHIWFRNVYLTIHHCFTQTVCTNCWNELRIYVQNFNCFADRKGIKRLKKAPLFVSKLKF